MLLLVVATVILHATANEDYAYGNECRNDYPHRHNRYSDFHFSSIR